jgi:shikimate kinase
MNISESSSFVLKRTVVLTGMMGAGKSSVGRKLAAWLGGEPEFRKGERRVIARLLDGPVHVLSTGGGAFMDEETRALIAARGISVWLTAEMDILLERALRRDNRPLLQGGDPRQKLVDLLEKRAPVYARADITVKSDDRPVDETVERVLKELEAFVRRTKTAS